MRPTLESIQNEVANFFEIDISEVKTSTRGITNIPRAMVMLMASKHYGYKHAEIADYFKVSSCKTPSNLSAALLVEMRTNKNLESQLTNILAKFKY